MTVLSFLISRLEAPDRRIHDSGFTRGEAHASRHDVSADSPARISFFDKDAKFGKLSRKGRGFSEHFYREKLAVSIGIALFLFLAASDIFASADALSERRDTLSSVAYYGTHEERKTSRQTPYHVLPYVGLILRSHRRTSFKKSATTRMKVLRVVVLWDATVDRGVTGRAGRSSIRWAPFGHPSRRFFVPHTQMRSF